MKIVVIWLIAVLFYWALIHGECKANRECVECAFYIYDEENDLDGCIFGEVDVTEIGRYEL